MSRGERPVQFADPGERSAEFVDADNDHCRRPTEDDDTVRGLQ